MRRDLGTALGLGLLAPVLVGLGLVVVASCALSALPEAGAAATPIARSFGYLEGQATIGPLTPVERVDMPAPTPSPQVCRAVGLLIVRADGTAEVKRLTLEADCSYGLPLETGTYTVRLNSTSGVQFSKDLPRTITIDSGRNTRLDFHLDTGIR